MSGFLNANSEGVFIETENISDFWRGKHSKNVVVKKISNSKFGAFSSPAKSYYLIFEKGSFDLPESNAKFLELRNFLFEYLGIQNSYFEINFDLNGEFILYKNEIQ